MKVTIHKDYTRKTIGCILALLFLPITFMIVQVIIKEPVDIFNLQHICHNIYLQAFLAGFIMEGILGIILGLFIITLLLLTD